MKQWNAPMIEELNIQETAYHHGGNHKPGHKDPHDNRPGDNDHCHKPGNNIPQHTPGPGSGHDYDFPFWDQES